MSESLRGQAEPGTQARLLVPALSVEVTLYAVLGLVALATRLLLLDYYPLSAGEAMQAVAAWHFVNGIPDPFTGSPLLFTANSLLFALFGATDLSARWLPALFGTALVLLPALWREQLGKVGALIASLLLAFSPSLVFFSRNLDSAMVAATCSLAALSFAWRYAVTRARRDMYLGAVLAALAIVSGREIWTVVVALAAFAVVRWRRLRYVLEPGPGDLSDGPVPSGDGAGERSDRRRAGVVFLVLLVGVATSGLLHREGVGATFDLFGAWLDGLRPGGSWFDALRVLVLYEPLILVFGAAGVIDVLFEANAAGRERVPLAGIAFWAVVAFLLYSIGGDKDPARVVMIVVPLALLAGANLGGWLERSLGELGYTFSEPSAWLTQDVPVYLFSLALAGFLYLVLAEFVTRGSVLAADLFAPAAGGSRDAASALNSLMLLAVFAVVVAAIAVLAVTTVGVQRAKFLGLALGITLLSAWTFRQMTLVSFSQTLNPQEWLVARATSPNVRDLVGDLEDISRWRADDSHTLDILVDDSLGPIVQWYLRDFKNAHFVAHPVVAPGTEAMLVRVDTPVKSSGLMNQDYRLETWRSGAFSSFLSWLVFRQGGGTQFTDVALWIPQAH